MNYKLADSLYYYFHPRSIHWNICEWWGRITYKECCAAQSEDTFDKFEDDEIFNVFEAELAVAALNKYIYSLYYKSPARIKIYFPKSETIFPYDYLMEHLTRVFEKREFEFGHGSSEVYAVATKI